MARATLRLVLGNLRGRFVQTVLLGLVIALAAGTLALSLSVRSQAGAPFERLMADSNGAHVWFLSPSRGDLEEIAEDPAVRGIAGPYPRAWATGLVDGEPVDLSFWGMPAALPDISTPQLDEGRWLSGPGEMVVEAGFAREAGLEAGDELRVATEGTDAVFTVVGIARITSRAPYPTWGPAHVFVSEATLIEASPSSEELSWELGVQLKDAALAGGFIGAHLQPGQVEGDQPRVTAINAQRAADAVAEESEVVTILLSVFSLFGLVAAALIAANVVSSTVLSQVREIGVLKAIGFSPAAVAGVFALEQAGLALVAAFVGAMAGAAISPFFLADVAVVLNPSPGLAFEPGIAAAVAAGVTVLVSLAAFLPAWHAGRVPAVRALTGRSGRARGISRLERIGARLGLSPVLRAGLKDAFARPVRSWFMIAAMATAVATIAMTLSIDATLVRAKDDPAMFANESFDMEISVEDGTSAEAVAARVSDLSHVAAAVQQEFASGRVAGGSRPFFLRAVGGDIERLFPAPFAGEYPRAAGEVMVAAGLAEAAGVTAGSRLEAMVDTPNPDGGGPVSRPMTFTVTGIYADSDDDGMLAITTWDSLADAGREHRPASVGIRLDSYAAAGSVEEALRELYPLARIVNEVQRNRDDVAEVTASARPILFGLNTVLIVVAAVNVLTVLFFAVREQYREIGIFKAIGFTPAQVGVAVSSGVLFLALIAIVVGIPVGLVLTEWLFDFFGSEEGWRPGVAVTPAWWRLALIVPAGLGFAVLGALIPARHAARLRVAEALRVT